MTFRVQYVAGVVANGVTQMELNAPDRFVPITSLDRAFILPATTMPTVGIGAQSGSTQMRAWALNCDISSTTQILLNRANGTNPSEFAFWIIEYIGPPGGPNEFIMRGKRIFTFTEGSTAANSNAIAGIVDPSRCVPFINLRHSDVATNALRHFLVEARMHVSGGSNVMALTRVLTDNGEPTCAAYCVEFTGSNWTVQTGTESNWTANTTKDTVISPAYTTGKAWLYGHFLPGNRDTPAGQTWYAWLFGNNTLRTRAIEVSSLSTLRYWIISNSDLRFGSTFYNFVDGTVDIGGGSALAQSRNITISPVSDNGSLVTGWAGSSSTSTLDQPAGQWRVNRVSPTTAQIYRTRSLGSSEYAIQVLTLPADDASLIINPAPASLPMTGPEPNGPVTRTPAPAYMWVQGFGSFSEVSRTPAPAALRLIGGTAIPHALFPATGIISFANEALGDIPKETVLTPPIPAIDYDQKINAPPTIIIGTVLTPSPADLPLQVLAAAVGEGGDIGFRSPLPASLTFAGALTAVAVDTTEPAQLIIEGLAPDLQIAETVLEPGIGVLNAPGFASRPVGVFIPHEWVDVEPAPVVEWLS